MSRDAAMLVIFHQIKITPLHSRTVRRNYEGRVTRFHISIIKQWSLKKLLQARCNATCPLYRDTSIAARLSINEHIYNTAQLKITYMLGVGVVK